MTSTTDREVPAWVPIVLRVGGGALFLVTGIAKFTARATEVADFDRWGVPFPATTVTLVGILEIVGGIALVVGLYTRVAAALLAMDMVGAIVTAGRIDGGAFHLVVAPLLLVAMVCLVVIGPGPASLDARRGHRSGN